MILKREIFLILFVAVIRIKAIQHFYAAEPVTVLSLLSNGSFNFNSAQLNKILTHKDVKDRKICVISMAGEVEGKSLILDYFLRYLYTNYPSVESTFKPLRMDNHENWLGDADESLKGFSWISGHKLKIKGIVIWSDVFLHDAPNGDKIAILLMDTKGLLNEESINMVYLGGLLSSTQIFNVFDTIKVHHFNYFKLFAEFDKFFHQTPYQNLNLLVRNWTQPELHPFGSKGGQSLLEEFKTKSSIDIGNLSCTLMTNQSKQSVELFDGRWSQLDPDFLKEMKSFTETLLSPNNLKLKTFNGQFIISSDFFAYFKEFVKVFDSRILPTANSIHTTTVDVHMTNLVNRSCEAYNETVITYFLDLSDKDDIDSLQTQAIEEAFSVFTSGVKVGNEEDIDLYKDKLRNLVRNDFWRWRPYALNLLKKKDTALARKEKEENAARERQANVGRFDGWFKNAFTDAKKFLNIQ